jgi:deoxyadenosine/deoxycytidine kinase
MKLLDLLAALIIMFVSIRYIFYLCILVARIRRRYICSPISPIIITVEGNIGVGKTTFLDNIKLCDQINKTSTVVSEPVDIWLNINDDDGENILGKFYKDKRRWSYTFQNFSYITKMTTLVDAIRNSGKEIIFLDRSIGTDKYVFAKMLRDDRMLGSLEFTMYNLWSNFYDKYIAKNNKKNIIYLRCDPIVAFDRIQIRGRKEEKDIPMDYLNSLHKYHERWIEKEIKFKKSNVLILDWNENMNEEQIKEQIKEHVCRFVNNC